MPRFTKYDMQTEMLRMMASTLAGVALQYEREQQRYNNEAVNEQRKEIATRLFEVADKIRGIACLVEG